MTDNATDFEAQAEKLFGETNTGGKTEELEPKSSYTRMKDSERPAEEKLYGKPQEKKYEDVFEKEFRKEEPEKAPEDKRSGKEVDTSHDETDEERLERQTEAAEKLLEDPELDIDVNDPMAPEFTAFAARHDMDGEAAKEMMEMHQAHNEQAWETIHTQWAEEANALPEEDIEAAQTVYREFAEDDPELGYLVETLGLGNNPAFLKFLSRVGRGR